MPGPVVRHGVAVIGIGNWGSSLAAALMAIPHMQVERVHARPRRRAKQPRLDTKLLWLCVPDRAIASTAAWIAACRGDMRGQIVVHSSGALDRSVLAAVEGAGAHTASVHPMMSFPTRRGVSLAGTWFGVESADVSTRRWLFALIRKLGGQAFAINSGNKAMYHAGAMFASPLLVAALDAGVRCMEQAGLSEREAIAMLGPMAQATVMNVQRRGLARSFSGPVARGDATTIKLHRNALAGHPLLAHAYDALALLAVNDLPSADRAALRTALHDASNRK